MEIMKPEKLLILVDSAFSVKTGCALKFQRKVIHSAVCRWFCEEYYKTEIFDFQWTWKVEKILFHFL